jgi:zinc D-Ala-D-Ala dipeptidase
MQQFLLLLFLFSSVINASHAHVLTAENKQLILVLTESWVTTNAHLFRYTLQDDGRWKISPLDPIPAVIGKTGLAWGIGLHKETDISVRTPVKEEGDGKAPAGAFRIGKAFGYDDPPTSVKLDKVKLSPSIECVDDSGSDYYNLIVDRKSISEPSWKSSEVMRRKDELYRLGIQILHNPEPAQKKKGSCIFIHVWDGPGTHTSGCTALHQFHVLNTMKWLDPALKPVMIQLPWSEYLRLRNDWKLPEIDKNIILTK